MTQLLKQVDPACPKLGFSHLISGLLLDWYTFGCSYWQESYRDDRRILSNLYPGTVLKTPGGQILYYDIQAKTQLHLENSTLVAIPWSTLPLPTPVFLLEDILIAIANAWGWNNTIAQWELSRKIASQFAYQDQVSFSASLLFNDLSPNAAAIVSLEEASNQLNYEAWLEQVIIHSLKSIFAYCCPEELRSISARKLDRKFSMQSQSEYLLVMGIALSYGLSRLSQVNFEFL